MPNKQNHIGREPYKCSRASDKTRRKSSFQTDATRYGVPGQVWDASWPRLLTLGGSRCRAGNDER